MRVRTDDDVYRVDAVWLGPPKATFPWRARYVSWGIGGVLFLLLLGAERQVGIGFGFFSTAWALVLTVLLTKVIGSRINHERPLRAVATMWLRELNTPREQTRASGGAASTGGIKVRRERPRPPGAVTAVTPARAPSAARVGPTRIVPARTDHTRTDHTRTDHARTDHARTDHTPTRGRARGGRRRAPA